MKTTLIALYTGLTIRLVVCGSIVNTSYAYKNHFMESSHTDSVAVVHHRTMSYER
jgi:hypothetical protein